MSDVEAAAARSDYGSRRILIVSNPGAGGGRSGVRLRRAFRVGAIPGVAAVEISSARSAEEVCEILEKSDPRVVPVAAGGDGTLSMLAMALDLLGKADPTIGVLPLGTMNILAREFGLGSLGVAMRALGSSAVRPLDVMRTSHPAMPIALTSLSGGFEGEFVARYCRFRRFGRPMGVFAGLTTARWASRPVTLEVDGEVIAAESDHAFSAGLYNARCYPLNVVMSPDADLSDGRGEGVAYLSAGSFWMTVAAGFGRGLRGEISRVVRRQWSTARIETEGRLQIDGESIEGGSVTVRMRPSALRILVPEVGVSHQ